jgi:hypothetical protein
LISKVGRAGLVSLLALPGASPETS